MVDGLMKRRCESGSYGTTELMNASVRDLAEKGIQERGDETLPQTLNFHIPPSPGLLPSVFSTGCQARSEPGRRQINALRPYRATVLDRTNFPQHKSIYLFKLGRFARSLARSSLAAYIF